MDNADKEDDTRTLGDTHIPGAASPLQHQILSTKRFTNERKERAHAHFTFMHHISAKNVRISHSVSSV